MKVLVTGGAGFIGSSIARALLELGNEVRIIDNLASGFERNIPPEAEFHQADIRGESAVDRACKGIDVVFHQAAFKSVPKSVEDPITAETSNAVGTLRILLAARGNGVKRVIYASSSSVYGDADGVKTEAMATNPISPYGVSKLAGEHHCRVWTRVTGLSTVSLRYFNVFGPGQHPDSRYAAVFPAFISSLQRGKQIQIHGDGRQTRDFTFIDDVVRANILAMDADGRVDGQVMNVCAGFPRSVIEVFETVSEIMDKSVEPLYVPPRVGDILHSQGDISKARLLLDWSPEADWWESVAKTVKWFESAAS